jgi:hypothetical protein
MEQKSFSLRTLRAGTFAVALLTGGLVACSGSGPQMDSGANAPAQPVAESTPPAAQPAPAPAETAPLESSEAPAASPSQDESAASMVSPTAPNRYTVKSGDTLWDIASTFLRDPWYWPEIWYVNPQIENPHLIYPGDTLVLAYGADGEPQIRLERGTAGRLAPRVRSEPLEGPITTIPYAIVAAFMSKPTVLEKDQIKHAPYLVSSRDQHLAMAAGNTVYARGKIEGDVNSRYSVVHVGEPLRDPDDGDVVGYQGLYAGTARLTRQGDPASLVMTESAREALEGDRLMSGDVDVPMDFIPHPAAKELSGRVISIVNGVYVAGQYQVVVINRGKRDGVEPGHVFTISTQGQKVRDRYASGGFTGVFGSRVQLPDERAATFMVFKAFDRISYGLIMEAEAPVRVMDRVAAP